MGDFHWLNLSIANIITYIFPDALLGIELPKEWCPIIANAKSKICLGKKIWAKNKQICRIKETLKKLESRNWIRDILAQPLSNLLNPGAPILIQSNCQMIPYLESIAVEKFQKVGGRILILKLFVGASTRKILSDLRWRWSHKFIERWVNFLDFI